MNEWIKRMLFKDEKRSLLILSALFTDLLIKNMTL